MRLNELFEAEGRHVTFVFGRMNPPTIGHKQLLDTAKSVGGDYKIFLSQTQDPKKNPLDYSTKIKFVKIMFPEHADNVVEDSGLNTIVKVADYLYNMGYKNATFVAGSDRLDAMKQLLTQYNGVEGKAHGFYKFDVLDFKSSGEREDGAEGVAGVSASNARAAAANGDLDAFKDATGAGQHAEALFAAVRAGMGIQESNQISYWKDLGESLSPIEKLTILEELFTKQPELEEGCKYGTYYCSTDKTWKCRKGMLVEGETDPYKKYPRAIFPDTKARNMRIAAQKRLNQYKSKKQNKSNFDSDSSIGSPVGGADYVGEGTFTNSRVRYMPGSGRGEGVAEGKFRKVDAEEKVIPNNKLNNLKSKYLPDWEMLDHRILQAKYVAKDHRHAEEFVSFINRVSEEMDHFAEVTQDVAEVTVKTTTFDVKGLTILDFKLALKIDKFAEQDEIEQVRMQGNFGMHESSYGRYYCSTDKKWKQRKGPKQKRSS
jgi:pterin-4a-carbinolamine dehydratase